MTSQNEPSSKLNLIFNPKPSPYKSFLLKVDKQLLKELQNTEQLMIEGNAQDEIILNSNTKSYKVKGINISTSLLVINEAGIIMQQTGSYLDAQKFNPHFQQIYGQLTRGSLGVPDGEIDKMGFQDLVAQHGFTEYEIKKKFFLGQEDFQRLGKAMGLIKVNGDMEQACYLHMTLGFMVWVIRKIISIYSQSGKNLLEPLQIDLILQQIPLINSSIVGHIAQTYHLQSSGPSLQLTPKSIIRYILSQMWLAKKHYLVHTFEQMLDQLLLIYMPAGINVTSGLIREKGSKDMEEFYNLRYDYFIDPKGDKYVAYDFMAIQTDLSARLKFLSGYKNRWSGAELKAIFRGIDSTEGGKFYPLSDVLLKKFRKYGEQYEIKFILPTK